MDRSIFRAYSIRGIVGESLTVADMLLIGQAAGTLLAEQDILTAVVGHDYRNSSPALVSALQRGLLSAGVGVISIGACATPVLNFATDHYQAGAGLMVTASHNPPHYNGLKIRTDHTLGGDELGRICELADRGSLQAGRGTLSPADPSEAYLGAVRERAPLERPLRVVVDAGNGAAGPIAPRLVSLLGCQVVPLYCEPDGSFPNRLPDPTARGALDPLAERVVRAQADAGVAYDGDADRLAMVDETGQVVLADRLLCLLAKEALREQPGACVVHDVSCTQALPETVVASGGTPVPCPVGYAFVHEAMRETGAVLGGETAGHIFWDDADFRFDDALLTTAKMLALLSRADRPFSVLLASLPHYTLSEAYRFHCPEEYKDAAVGLVGEQFAAQGHTIDTVDGVKIHFAGFGRTGADGWALFRASNTQPAVTLRCEARTPEQLAEIECAALDAVREALASLGIEMRDAH